MKYLMLLYGNPIPEPGTPEARKLSADWAEARQAMTDAGVLIECSPLQPASASTTVRVRDGETLTTDGPFAETKEWMSGFYVVDFDSLDQALKAAAMVPSAKYGSVEVRPVAEM